MSRFRIHSKQKPRQGRQLSSPVQAPCCFGAQCGVNERRLSRSPKAGDSAEEMNLFDGIQKDLIRVLTRFEYILVRLIITCYTAHFSIHGIHGSLPGESFCCHLLIGVSPLNSVNNFNKSRHLFQFLILKSYSPYKPERFIRDVFSTFYEERKGIHPSCGFCYWKTFITALPA